jgi:DNA-binding MarR family transcriptional regulator
MTFVTPQAANEMVATLERKGFLTRSVDEGNRRRLDVVITPAGTTALARCDDLVAQLETEIFRDIDPTDQRHFKQLLQQAIEAAQPRRP